MQGKVSVGLATVTGYSVSTVAFVGAVLAYLGGDHSDQTVAIIGCGVVGALAFVVTNVGRYLQARSVIKYGPWQVSSKTLDVEKSETTTSSSGNAGLPASWDTPYPPTGSTAAPRGEASRIGGPGQGPDSCEGGDLNPYGVTR